VRVILLFTRCTYFYNELIDSYECDMFVDKLVLLVT